MVLCPTIEHNKIYKRCPWLWTDPEIYVLDPGERLHNYLRAFCLVFKGEPTLFIIDDCSATKGSDKEERHAVRLAFSGRHADISVWVQTQKCNSVLKYLRELTRWVALFHCKERDSFEDCLRENDVMPTRGVGAAAASREKTCQASVENRSACCLYSSVAMLPVIEGLLVAVLGTHLVLLVFVAWQIAQCLCRVALHIRRARRFVLSEMDCDELIDELMSVADLQGPGAGLAEGAPPAAAPTATPDAPQEEERVQNTANCSLPSRREAKPGSMDWWFAGKHSLLIKSTLWITPKSRSCTPLRSQAGDGDDEDLGVCGGPALCGGGGHVSPNRKPARAYRRPRERPVCWTRA